MKICKVFFRRDLPINQEKVNTYIQTTGAFLLKIKCHEVCDWENIHPGGNLDILCYQITYYLSHGTYEQIYNYPHYI